MEQEKPRNSIYAGMGSIMEQEALQNSTYMGIGSIMEQEALRNSTSMGTGSIMEQEALRDSVYAGTESTMGQKACSQNNSDEKAQTDKRKQTAQALLAACKDEIADIIGEAAKNHTSDTYKMLADAVFNYDDESVTRWFNTHTDSMVSRAKVCEYDNARLKLENVFKSAAQNKQMETAYMLKIERAIGSFIKKKFMEFEILSKYQEPEIQQDSQNTDHHLMLRGYILGILMGALIFVIGCFFGLIGKVAGLVCAVIAAAVIGKTYYAWRRPDKNKEMRRGND